MRRGRGLHSWGIDLYRKKVKIFAAGPVRVRPQIFQASGGSCPSTYRKRTARLRPLGAPLSHQTYARAKLFNSSRRISGTKILVNAQGAIINPQRHRPADIAYRIVGPHGPVQDQGTVRGGFASEQEAFETGSRSG
jgi:hypothetical protein